MKIDRKGQMTVGLILTGFIAILVGVILMQGTFSFIGTSVNSQTLTNRTFTAPAAGSTIDLVGQELLSTPVVSNRTNTSQAMASAGNYTIFERVSPVDGLKRIAYTSNTNSVFAGTPINVSYDYGAEGYIDDAGGRGVTNLIPVMMALAILATAVTLAYRKGWFD